MRTVAQGADTRRAAGQVPASRKRRLVRLHRVESDLSALENGNASSGVNAEDLRMLVNPQAGIDMLRHYFRAFERGMVLIWAKPPEAGDQGGNEDDSSYCAWVHPDDLDALHEDVIGQFAGTNIYFGVATRSTRMVGNLRGGITECAALAAFVVDIDVFHPEVHAAQNLPTTLDEARALLTEFPLKNLVVNTGFGLQAHYLLAEPLEAQDASMWLARWNATWQEIFARHGLHLDNVSNLDRVMRLVGGVNQNAPGDPRPVYVEVADWGHQFDLSDLDEVLVLVTQEAERPPSHTTSSGQPWIERDWFNEHNTGSDVFKAKSGWTLVKAYRDGQESWRRPGKSKGTTADVYPDGHIAVWSPTPGIPTSLGTKRKTYDAWGLHVHLNYGSNAAAFTQACDDLRAEHPKLAREWDRQRQSAAKDWVRTDDGRDRDGSADNDGKDDEDEYESTVATSLPDEFWDSRPVLQHIRQAAHSRGRSAAAVLNNVLARAGGMLPHTLKLPAIVGSEMTLSFYGVNVSPPGTGRSGAISIATELLPWPHDIEDLLPIGSGEGLYDWLFGMVQEGTDAKGKPIEVRKQIHHNAIFSVDEGQLMTALSDGRSGSTLVANLCSAWT
jgi:hypothetical protein